MTKTVKLTLAAGALALVAAAAAPALMAQDGPQGPGRRGWMGGPPPGGPGGFGGPMGLFGPGLRGLDLTDDQRAEVKKIRESHEAEFKQVGEKMRAAREAMGALLDATPLDEAAIRAKVAEVAAIEGDAAILNAKVRAEVKGILTAEQIEKLKTLHENGPARRMRGAR